MRYLKKAVVVFSGGLDSVCMGAHLKSKYDLYGISFVYGQKASQEIKTAKSFAKSLGLKKHKILNIDFMKNLYGETNVLTSSKKKIPSKFDYSIVVPIRNAIFLSIATAWAYTLGAPLVAFGAHKGDTNYPDCRPLFSKKLEEALFFGEIDGIKSGKRKQVKIWSPYRDGYSKSKLLLEGKKILGDKIFKTWSCYSNKRQHCGECESCINRKNAFKDAGIIDKTRYLK